MPTVILLDVSLSMCRLSSRQTSNKDAPTNPHQDSVEIRQLANVGIGTLLDYLAQNSQLEHTSLVVFSSLWEIRNQFTRNHESIKSGIYELELYDKSNIVNALRGVNTMKLDEWSQNGVINIILVTDGHYNVPTSCADSRGDDFGDILLEELEGQFNFPCKIQVVCLSSPRNPILKHNLGFFKKLVATIDASSHDCPVIIGNDIKHFEPSAIWLPDPEGLDVTVQSVESLFNNITELHYKPYHGILSFGRLSSMVLLSPKPSECLVEPLKNEFDDLNEESQKGTPKQTFVSALNKSRLFNLNDEIIICGFMASKEIASPAVTSRHLVMPIPHNKFDETSKAQQILSQDPNAYSKSLQTCPTDGPPIKSKPNALNRCTIEPSKSTAKSSAHSNLSPNEDITKQPSFCVLLHNCLKQENTVGVCIVGRNADLNEDWFGLLHPHVDARKRSNLMLSLLLPGHNPILWLPNFGSLGSVSLNSDAVSLQDKNANNRGPLKSYSSNNVIWLDPESVQADVQRIVRHVKRGLDKAPHFYKELNRIRRAAISYGFYDVLSGLASILEREKSTLVPDQSKPGYKEIIKHIDHVIASLRTDLNDESYDTRLIPPVQ